MTSISFVIPVFNEEGNIERLIAEIQAVCAERAVNNYEILPVSDGSTDGTNSLLKKLSASHPRVRGIVVRVHQGKAAALSAGFEHARGEIIVTLDGDGQDDPHELPKLLAKLDEGYDMVSGWKQQRLDSFMKNQSSRVFNAVTRFMTKLDLHDYNCGFKAYRREAAKQLLVYGELHRYIPVLLAANGFTVTEVPVKHRKRWSGRSKYGTARYLHGYFDLITILTTIRFGSRPFHLFGYIGTIFFGMGFSAGLYLTAIKLLYGAKIGDRPLLLFAVMLMIMGVEIALTGLVGELLTYIIKQQRHVESRSNIVMYEHENDRQLS